MRPSSDLHALHALHAVPFEQARAPRALCACALHALLCRGTGGSACTPPRRRGPAAIASTGIDTHALRPRACCGRSSAGIGPTRRKLQISAETL